MTTVLVVDDSLVARKVAGGYVESQGLTALFAENGREALEVIEREHPDIVLTDLMMPEMDGLELVKRIRLDYSRVPVILMTAHGSEETAVNALNAGASSYVPKQNLESGLDDALRIVLATLEATREREKVRSLLERSESRFILGYEPDAPRALISYLQDALAQLSFCDETAIFQLSTALAEAITNAIDHGNLELDSTLREDPGGAYFKQRQQRMTQTPYLDRRVHVTATVTSEEATYVVRDEGEGFDPSTLPDPLDAENLLKASGRGIMLIRTFMDDVSFNEQANEITMVKRRTQWGD